MKKTILTYPDNKDILTQESSIIEDITSEETKQLAQDLIDTLLEEKTGVGISAIQIGVPKQMCVINYGTKEPIVMINPVITWARSGINGMKAFPEGCLSTPGVYALVVRPQKVICEYYDLNGNKQSIGEGGWMSAIIQHELDHFTGHCELFDAADKNGN